MSQTVFVTGATGYIGGRVAEHLARKGYEVRCGCRRAMPARDGINWVQHGELAEEPDWERILQGSNAVVHCAGLAAAGAGEGATERIQAVNAEGTGRLADGAVRAGVSRTVFLSTALVYGASAADGPPLTETDPVAPRTAYARSKLAGEQRLRGAAEGSAMTTVVLRLPMVYGPGSAGNFRRLVRLVERGAPLPFGRATAPKSFVSIQNLVSAVAAAVHRAGAENELFLVTDNETTSTVGLIELIAAGLGRRARLLPVPKPAMRALGRIAGRADEIASLFEPLHLDNAKLRARLEWSPKCSLADGVAAAVAGKPEGMGRPDGFG